MELVEIHSKVKLTYTYSTTLINFNPDLLQAETRQYSEIKLIKNGISTSEFNSRMFDKRVTLLEKKTDILFYVDTLLFIYTTSTQNRKISTLSL